MPSIQSSNKRWELGVHHCARTKLSFEWGLLVWIRGLVPKELNVKDLAYETYAFPHVTFQDRPAWLLRGCLIARHDTRAPLHLQVAGREGHVLSRGQAVRDR